MGLLQINYAGLDAFTGALLYKHIIANADPIHFRAPPKEGEILLGGRLNLYTKNSHTLVEQGSVVEGDRGAIGCVTITLTVIRVPGALAPHPRASGHERQPLSEWYIGERAKWDLVRFVLVFTAVFA